MKAGEEDSEAEGETDAWLADYNHSFIMVDDDTQAVYLEDYFGEDREISVPAEAKVDGTSYPVTCSSSVWSNAEKIVFEPGFIFLDCNCFFRYHTSLVEVDMSGVDASRVTSTEEMFYGYFLCGSLGRY